MTAEERAEETVALIGNLLGWTLPPPQVERWIADAIRASVAEAVAPMACGHPRVCRIWTYYDDEPRTAYCAWCNSLAQEREACVAMAEQFLPVPAPTAAHQAAADLVRSIAAAIRARGGTGGS